jgi:molybdopterin molybdotransferase
VGLLASVGRDRVRIHRRPRVAVLGTGDELVPIIETPGPGRIRDSNSWSLTACCRRAGVPVERLGVAKDTEDDLREKIGAGLACDVLLVSGGVSMGEWDLVPKVFDAFGVTVHFATVRMKPGKPTVFATTESGILLGLPGNPVSTLVAWRLFVWPALRKMMGHPDPAPPPVLGTLTAALKARGDRTTFVPVHLSQKDGAWSIEPVTTRGSADLVRFARADALAILEPGMHEAGATVQAVPLELQAAP